jgi:hypothetical protein
MAISKPISPATPCNDEGFVVLVVPFGAAWSRRIVVPHEVAAWLRDELAAALDSLRPAKKIREG